MNKKGVVSNALIYPEGYHTLLYNKHKRPTPRYWCVRIFLFLYNYYLEGGRIRIVNKILVKSLCQYQIFISVKPPNSSEISASYFLSSSNINLWVSRRMAMILR